MGKSIFTVTGITTTGDEKEVHVTGTTHGNKRMLDILLGVGGNSILSGQEYTFTASNAAYTSGDQYGPTSSDTVPITLTNLMPIAGGSGRITYCRVISNTATGISNPEFDIAIFSQTVTLPGNNAAFTITAAHSLHWQGVIEVRDPFWRLNSGVGYVQHVPSHFLPKEPIQAASGSRDLFACLIARETGTMVPTSFAITLKVE